MHDLLLSQPGAQLTTTGMAASLNSAHSVVSLGLLRPVCLKHVFRYWTRIGNNFLCIRLLSDYSLLEGEKQ